MGNLLLWSFSKLQIYKRKNGPFLNKLAIHFKSYFHGFLAGEEEQYEDVSIFYRLWELIPYAFDVLFLVLYVVFFVGFLFAC